MNITCSRKELAKTLTNSVPVTLFPPLGGEIPIRVYLLSTGEYFGVFERPTKVPEPPPLESAAAFNDEPPTAPALATQQLPTAPPAASTTGFWPLAQNGGGPELARCVHL